ncbi:hypothetical protein HAX54_053066 [Datura stramonium]|uniref:Uncharacterized protein n=1 Tax=Datura stramonium TaxID=4076 RepID=A0ABS8WS51_DATST|nr:hypothetical protein [Datura stramonium]
MPAGSEDVEARTYARPSARTSEARSCGLVTRTLEARSCRLVRGQFESLCRPSARGVGGTPCGQVRKEDVWGHARAGPDAGAVGGHAHLRQGRVARTSGGMPMARVRGRRGHAHADDGEDVGGHAHAAECEDVGKGMPMLGQMADVGGIAMPLEVRGTLEARICRPSARGVGGTPYAGRVRRTLGACQCAAGGGGPTCRFLGMLALDMSLERSVRKHANNMLRGTGRSCITQNIAFVMCLCIGPKNLYQ